MIKIVFCDDTSSILELAERTMPMMWQLMWTQIQEKCGVSEEAIPEIILHPILMDEKSGEQAIDAIAEQHPDVILADLSMPGMGGLELAQRLDRRPDTKHIPIIAVSACDEGWYTRQILKGGLIADFQAKPFRYNDFFASILKCAGYKEFSYAISP